MFSVATKVSPEHTEGKSSPRTTAANLVASLFWTRTCQVWVGGSSQGSWLDLSVKYFVWVCVRWASFIISRFESLSASINKTWNQYSLWLLSIPSISPFFLFSSIILPHLRCPFISWLFPHIVIFAPFPLILFFQSFSSCSLSSHA